VTNPPPVTPPPVTPPAPTLDGAALYASNCSGCHGAIGAIRAMPVSNRNVADFQRAISSNKGGMGFLGTLTVAQLQAIADAIKAANP
jgi:mono/diheme cytochrome c family protein